jgi:hypothetical protein
MKEQLLTLAFFIAYGTGMGSLCGWMVAHIAYTPGYKKYSPKAGAK